MSTTRTDSRNAPNQIWLVGVVFAAAYINFSVDGYNFVFGLLKLEVEKEYPHIEKQWIALIGSLVPGLYCILAPLTSLVARKIGMPSTIIIAVGFQLAGFVLAFFNRFKWGYTVDFVTLGVFQGVGSALLLTNSISSITDMFDKKGKALAKGFVTAGSPLGAIFYGAFFKTFIEATPFGWRGALLFFTGLAGVNILCGLVFIPLRNDQSDAELEIETKPKSELCTYKFLGLLIMTSLFIMGYYVPPLLIPGQARNPKYGVSAGVGNNIILIWGVANCIGRIVTGFVADKSYRYKHERPYLTSYTIVTFCTIVCAAAMFVFPHVMIHGNISFVVLQIVYGFFVAGGISLRSVILKELIGGSVSRPLAWMFFSDGVFVVIGFCLSAYVDTITPMWAYSFAGACFAAAVIFMFTLLQSYLAAYNSFMDKAKAETAAEGNKAETIELLPSRDDYAIPANGLKP